MRPFVDVDGFPTDSNEDEWLIRPANLGRQISFGTQSDRGCRFVERMMTVVETLKRQGRQTMSLLEGMWRHISHGESVPELLPA
jgi:transposase